MKSWVQHRFNPIHLYCRLANLIGRRMAREVASRYEIVIWRLIYD